MGFDWDAYRRRQRNDELAELFGRLLLLFFIISVPIALIVIAIKLMVGA